MFDSRSGSNARDNGSTVTFNVPQGMDSLSETQTALIQLVDFQASHTIYNITNSNNTLELYVQLYDTTGIALATTNTSTIITIANGYYNAYDLVNTLNTEILSACTPTARITNDATVNAAGVYYYNSFGFAANYGSTTGINPILLNTNTGKITFQIPSLACLADSVTSATSAYSNTDFCKHFYSGFYALSDTYPGLLLTLGFVNNDFTLLNTPTARHGVGCCLTPTATYASGKASVTYTVNNTLLNNLLDDINHYTVDATTGNVTGTYIVDLSYPRYLYLELEGLNSNNRTNLPNKSFRSMFAKIPVNASFGSLISYEPYVSIPQTIPNLHLNCLTVHLYDEFGVAAQLNNGFWSVVISVEWAVDVESAELEDVTLGRTFRPVLQATKHDPLETQNEYRNKRRR